MSLATNSDMTLVDDSGYHLIGYAIILIIDLFSLATATKVKNACSDTRAVTEFYTYLHNNYVELRKSLIHVLKLFTIVVLE